MRGLPLSVSYVHPNALYAVVYNGSGTVLLTGQDALQVVFSRPVIALGSDLVNATVQPFALHPAVPGTFRWASTFIARFDPAGPWPSDLRTQFRWNTIVSWDGLPLQMQNLRDATLTTEPLRMSVASVTSKQAAAATGGRWSAGLLIGGIREVPPDGVVCLAFSGPVEVDATMEALVLKSVAPAHTSDPPAPRPLLVADPEPAETSPESATARSSPSQPAARSTSQICITFSGEGLARGVEYTLELPAGTAYHPSAGLLNETATVALTGLKPFVLQFRHDISDLCDPKESNNRGCPDVWSRHMWMAMPYGISPGTTADDFERQLSLHRVLKDDDGALEALDMSITVDHAAGTVAIKADLLPEEEYRLSVLPTASGQLPPGRGVFSAFEQPLDTPTHQRHDVFFASGRTPVAFGPIVRHLRFITVDPHCNKGAEPQLPVVMSGKIGAKGVIVMEGLAVASAATSAALHASRSAPRYVALEDVLDCVFSDIGCNSGLSGPFDTIGRPVNVTSEVHNSATTIHDLPIGSLLEESGLAYLRVFLSDLKIISDNLVASSDVAVGFMAQGALLTAWALNKTSGEPIAGARLRLRRVKTGYSERAAPSHWLTHDVDTDEDGLATRLLPSYDTPRASPGAWVAVLTTPANKSTVLQLPNSWARAPSQRTFRASLVADKAIVAPGQAVHVKGYLREISSGTPTIPLSFPTARAAVSAWHPVAGPQEITLTVDPEFGSFELVLPCPDFYSQSLSSPVRVTAQICRQDSDALSGCEEWIDVGSLSVVVADPRTPTAEASLDAPQWVRPGEDVTVTVTAVSLIGAAVTESDMSIRWTLHRSASPAGAQPSGPEPSGVVQVATDAAGKAVAVIPIADKTGANFSEGSLALKLDWVGPTRELVTAATSVNVWRTRTAVTLAPSVYTDVPLQEFALLAAVRDRSSGAALDGRTIVVSTVTVSEQECAALPDCQSWRASKRSFTMTASPPRDMRVICTVSSTAAAQVPWDQCRYALPEVGIHLFTACTAPIDGEAVCQGLFMGMSPLEWGRAGLAAFPQPAVRWMRETHADGFTPGSSARLWLENPVRNATALISWISSRASGSTVVRGVGAGLQVLDVPVHPSCSTGCAVSVGLFWRRGAFRAPPGVTVNPLFDATLPSMRLVSLPPLTVVQQEPALEMGLTITGGEFAEGEAAAVVAPGRNVSIEIDLQICQGSGVDAVCTAVDSDVEVTVIVVDKSWLLMKEYPQPAPQDAFAVAPASFEALDTLSKTIGATALDFLAETAVRRLSIDPWTDAQQDPFAFDSALESDAQFFEGMKYRLTSSFEDGVLYSRLLHPPTLVDDQASEPPEVRKSSDFKATPLFQVLRLPAGGAGARSIPFTAPPNLGTFEIRAYAASARGDLFAAASSEVVVRRAKSLTAAVPRIARLHDAFLCGVVVTSVDGGASARPTTVEVSVAVSGGLQLQNGEVARRVVKFGAGRSAQEVRFAVKAVSIGNGTLEFAVSKGGLVIDALAVTLPVEVQQEPVTFASTFSVQADPAAADGAGAFWQEGLALPEAAPGSGTLQLIAGAGSFPALKAFALKLLSEFPVRAADATATWALSALLVRPVLLTYSPSALDTPAPRLRWMRPPEETSDAGENVTLEAATAAALTAAVRFLKDELTVDAKIGLIERQLPNFTCSMPATILELSTKLSGDAEAEVLKESPLSWLMSQPQKASVGLNLRAVWIVDVLQSLWPDASAWDAAAVDVSGLPGDEVSTPTPSTLEVVRALANEVWLPAAKKQLIQDAIKTEVNKRRCSTAAAKCSHREYDPYHSYWNIGSVILLYAHEGLDWDPSSDVMAAYKEDPHNDSNATEAIVSAVVDVLSLARVLREVPSMNTQSAAGLALALAKHAATRATAREELAAVCRKLASAFRFGGRSAYFVHREDAPSSYPGHPSEQALALLALVECGATQGGADTRYAPLLAKVAANLGSAPNYGSVAEVMLALGQFDARTGSARPNLTLTARSEPFTLMRAEFRTPDAPPARTSTPWDALAVPPAPLQVDAIGSGRVMVTVLGEFTPPKLLRFPLHRGIQVSLTVRRTVPTDTAVGTGPPLSVVGLGEIVQVAVQVLTPEVLDSQVHVRVLLPGGLEALDPSVHSLTCVLPWYYSSLMPDSGRSRGSTQGWSFSWWPCPFQSTSAPVVRFSVTRLQAGTHEFLFSAVAASAGNWTLPPATAFVVDQPEVMGQAAGGAFIVCPETPCSAAYLALEASTPATPKACPGDCNRAGTCDTATGQCACDPGFFGDDCLGPMFVI